MSRYSENGRTPSPNKRPMFKSRSVQDYQFGNTIGEGSYSTVYSAVDIHTKKTYAIKVLSKKHIVKENKIKYVNIEKSTLHRLGQQHPGIVQLYYTFQDDSSLFFVLDFAEYGELLSIIRKYGSLSEQVTRFYMCQLVDAVQFIHLKGVIHRDLKPENILVGYDFNLKITDFGAAKLLDIDDSEPSQLENIDYKGIDIQNSNNEPRKGSFVGTAEYVSPELLRDNVCGFEADVWALGCILYQFFNGVPPFKGATEYLTFEKIVQVNYSYRKNHPLPPGAVQIIDRILVDDIVARLTIPQLKEMPWFQGIPWDNKAFIWNRKVPLFEAYNPNNGPSSSNSATHSSPVAHKKAVNKSSSYQQLHAQIQNSSDYSFIPALGSAKRAYAPPTMIKKPPQVAPLNNAMAPLQNIKPQMQQMQQQPLYSNPPPPPPQFMPQNPVHTNKHIPDSYNSQSATSVPRKDAQSTLVTPPSPQKPGFKNVRQNTVFASNAKQNANVNAPPNLQKPLPPMDQLKIGESSTNSSSSRPPNSPVPSHNTQNSRPPISQVPSSTNSKSRSTSSSSNSRAGAANNNNSKPIRKSAAAAAAAAGAAGATQHPYQQFKHSAIPVRTSISKNIKLKEVSSLLEDNEKILKLDVILKLELSHKVVLRKPKEPLGDTTIEAIIKKHKSELRNLAKPVITVITNHARVLFIDSHLQVMLIDLKANQGADYLMYDYEFETVMLSDDEDDVVGSLEADGYLILELNKEGGDLIFLKRILEDTKLKETVMVVDKSGKELVLGESIGWIDCLLLAKDIMQNSPKEKPEYKSEKTPKPPKNGTHLPTSSSRRSSTTSLVKRTSNADARKKSPLVKSPLVKPPQIKSPQLMQASSSATSNSNGLGTSMRKFAYAAAAAAHK